MEKLSKPNKREQRFEKMREQKVEEVVLKAIEECATPEEKFKVLLQRNVDAEKNVAKLTAELKSQQRTMEGQQREKEAVQRDLNKCVLMRDKLQEVCREQQRIIKSVKNESMLQIKVEEERRKESQSKFQSSLNEITQSLTKNNEENIKLRDYNIEMTKKLKLLAEQYQTREKHLEKLNEQVQLEAQLHQAKLSKAKVEAAMEKEILTKENQIGLEKLLQAQRAIKDLTEREHQLKEQLNIYTAKYDEFQQSLQKSNEVFASYKVELEKMSKNTKKIEKEALAWRQKYEKSNAMVIELATEKQLRDQHAERCNKQVEQLQKLLRALQLERTSLHKKLREHDIEIPAMPSLPPEPEPMKIEPINSDKDKMELMTKNCAELKQTLASLQSQMKLLTTPESTTAGDGGRNNDDAQNKGNQSAKKNNKKKGKAKAKTTAAAAAPQQQSQPPSSSNPASELTEKEVEVEAEPKAKETEETKPDTNSPEIMPEEAPKQAEEQAPTPPAQETQAGGDGVTVAVKELPETQNAPQLAEGEVTKPAINLDEVPALIDIEENA